MLIGQILKTYLQNIKQSFINKNLKQPDMKEENYIGISSFFNDGSVGVQSLTEPKTLSEIRLMMGANDKDSKTSRIKLENHKAKIKNQWVNAFQSVNAGNANAHLSSYLMQPVNYYECYRLASDPTLNNVYDILSTTAFARGGEVVSPNISSNKLKEIDKTYKVTHFAKKALRTSLVVGGCLVYLDFGERYDLTEPLDLKSVNFKDFKGFRIIDPINCSALNVDMLNVTSEFYMTPKEWYIVGLGCVHASHFIKFEENVPETIMRPLYMYFGIPLTQLIKGDVANSNLVSQGVANLIGRFRNTYLKSPDSSFGTSGGAMQFKARLETMAIIQDNFSVMPLKVEEDILQLTTALSGLYENVELFYQLISAHTSIPIEKLLGKSSTGMNATGEGSRINFYDKIRNLQSNLKDNLIKMLTVAISAHNGKYTKINDYKFNELEEDYAKEKTEALKNNTEIAKSLIEMGADAEGVIKWLGTNNEGLGNITFDTDSDEGEYGDNGDDDPEPPNGGRKKDIAEENKKSNIKNDLDLFSFNNEFKEGDHPRDSEGKFTDKGTGESTDDSRNNTDRTQDRYDETDKRTDDFRRIQRRSVELLDELGRIEGRSRRYKRIDESVRRRYSGYVQRRLHASMDGDNHRVRILKSKTGAEFRIHNNIDPKLFHDAMQTIKPYLKQQELVDLHDDYSNCKCYLSDDGMQGFAITHEGNLISVFNADKNKKGFIKTVAEHIKEQGATHLDCYGGLAKFYKKHLGFQVASKMRYNMDYDHHEISRRYRNPTISFMVLSDKEITTRNFDKNEYDEAVEYQKQCLESVKTKQQNGEEWITVKGNHIKLKEGESKEEAVKRFVEEKQAKSKADISEILGKEYKNVKGKDAIDLLIQKKEGWVPDAFTRKDIGNIALIWGNEGIGLCHILKRREGQGINTEEFLQDISDVIEKGNFIKTNEKGRFEIQLNRKITVIEPEIKNGKLTFLITAFKRRK